MEADLLDIFSDEVLVHVAHFLPLASLHNLGRVCKKLQAVTREALLQRVRNWNHGLFAHIKKPVDFGGVKRYVRGCKYTFVEALWGYLHCDLEFKHCYIIDPDLDLQCKDAFSSIFMKNVREDVRPDLPQCLPCTLRRNHNHCEIHVAELEPWLENSWRSRLFI